jgi:hypothetical protein
MAAPFQVLNIIKFQDVQKMQQNLVYNYFKNPHFYISCINLPTSTISDPLKNWTEFCFAWKYYFLFFPVY